MIQPIEAVLLALGWKLALSGSIFGLEYLASLLILLGIFWQHNWRWQQSLVLIGITASYLEIPILPLLCQSIGLVILFVMTVPHFPKPPGSEVSILKRKLQNQTTGAETYSVFFYPTKEKPSHQVPWMELPIVRQLTKNGISKVLPSWCFSHFRLATLPVSYGANLTPQPSHPLILFSPGFKGFPEVYSSISMELASRGFIVCSVNHTDGTSSLSFDASIPLLDKTARNKQIGIRTQDLSSLLNLILNSSQDPDIGFICSQIDPKRIYVMGHSFGGASAMKFCQENPNIHACVCLDPWMLPLAPQDLVFKTHKPYLVLASDSWQWKENRIDIESVLKHGGSSSVVHYVKESLIIIFQMYHFLQINLLCRN